MKTTLSTYIYCLASWTLVVLLSLSTLVAQEGFRTEAIQYKDVQVRDAQGQLQVSCQIVIPQDVSPRNKALYIQPVYKTVDGGELLLPHLILNGKYQAPYYEREVALQSHEEYLQNRPYGVATLSGHGDEEPLVIDYFVSQALSSTTAGVLEVQYLGMDCCDADLLGALQLVSKKPRHIIITADALSPLIVAQEEPVKVRQEEIELRINYRFDRSEVLADYRQNADQLTHLRAALSPILQDPTSYKVHMGSITGYASPEGPEEHNKGLSERRAKSIKEFLIGQYGADLFGSLEVIGAGADWSGLRQVMEQAVGRSDREAVLAILNAGYTPEQRQEEMGKLSSYSDLLRNVYPPLRRSVLRIEYGVRAFTLAESIEVMKSRPKDLSIAELYRIAQYYEMQGQSAEEVYRITAEAHPSHIGAQVNYSRCLLLNGQLAEAWRILAPLQTEPLAYNNIGVYYMLSGDKGMAEQYLRKALSTPDAIVAQKNLEVLKQE